MVRIALQQRQRLLREGLRLLLDAEDGFEVIATAATAEEIVELCELSAPDVVLAEVDGGQAAVCALASTLRRLVPGVRLIGLYGNLGTEEARAIRRAGFLTLLPRGDGIKPIVGAVRDASQAVIPLRMAAPCVDRLTPREVDVLSLIGSGFTSGDVGRKLSISRKTVENHKQRIFRKLRVQNQAHAVSVAMRQGLIGAGQVGELAL